MTLTAGQARVLQAFADFGHAMDDTTLALFVHHTSDKPMPSSGIRTRRAELADKGLLEVVGTKRLRSGRSAAIWGLTAEGKLQASPSTKAVV